MPADDGSEPQAIRRFRGGPSTGDSKGCHAGLFHLGRFQSKAPEPASAAWCFTSLREEGLTMRNAEFRLPMLMSVTVLALTTCVGCSTKTQKPVPRPPGVTVAAVVQKDVPIHQEWVGTMVGNVDADIRPKVEGFLLTRLYTEGSFVRKGQPLFQLDRRQAQAAVDQAAGNLERH